MDCFRDICWDNRAMHIGRQLREGGFMPTRMKGKWRAPRRDGEWINHHQRPVIFTVKQMRAQDGRAAKIVSDDVRRLKFPMLQQSSKNLVLNAERYILPFAHLRLAIAQQIVEVHAPVADEVRNDPAPNDGAEGRAMNEDERGPFPYHPPSNVLAQEVEHVRQVPLSAQIHRHHLTPFGKEMRLDRLTSECWVN